MARSGNPRALRAALLVLGAILLGAAYLFATMPRVQADRIEPALGVTGVNTGRSLAWILRTRTGAVLIDAGEDRSAPRLLAELRRQGLTVQQIHTILLTHAHPDHWGGVVAFPKARVYAGVGDIPLLLGAAKLHGPLSGVLGGMMPPALTQVESAVDGQVLSLDGEEVRIVALPGHTPGTTAYLWKDLLFSGDALLGRGEDKVVLAPWVFSESQDQARESLDRLVELPFTRMADGHVGVTADARFKLLRMLRR